MRIAVIVNRGAGSAVTGRVSAGSLRQSFQQEGTEAEVHVIPGEQVLEAAREVLARRPDAVVAGGARPALARARPQADPHDLKVILPLSSSS